MLTLKAAYYNEHDPFAAAWLRELIKADLIASGEVDERDIREVRADDVRGYTQCHFFAGIGVWSYALRQAGWPDDKPVWTGSCPCQPFSVSGKRRGASDGRHLWPVWSPLIRESRPEFVFGEQVASDDGLAWLDLVSSDLEGQDYTVGAVDTCAAGFGAPHVRQRLYFCAHAELSGPRGRRAGEALSEPGAVERLAGLREVVGSRDSASLQGTSSVGLCAHAEHDGHDRPDRSAPLADCDQPGERLPDRNCSAGDLCDPTGERCGETQPASGGRAQRAVRAGNAGDGLSPERPRLEGLTGNGRIWRGPGWLDPEQARSVAASGATRGFWADCDWWYGRDGKYRPIKPGLFPLAHGVAARVLKLRGAGDAICAQQAAAFIRCAYEELLKG